jgi:hypothetical protein
LLQFAEQRTDRQAAEAVRARIDWKYALCLELDDPGFDYSVRCEFRGRRLAAEREARLFEALLTWVRARQLLRARGQQRTDSTHVLAVVRALNRVEVVVWVQQFRLEEDAVRWRAADDIPPAAVFIGSPYDEDAHYTRKATFSWVGSYAGGVPGWR